MKLKRKNRKFFNFKGLNGTDKEIKINENLNLRL